MLFSPSAHRPEQVLISAMEAHFKREDGWLVKTGFSADNCHGSQHTTILRIMREGEARGHQGERHVVRQMADELGAWLPQHVHRIDAAMVAHFEAVGFDAATNTFTPNRAVDPVNTQGCGGCEDS